MIDKLKVAAVAVAITASLVGSGPLADAALAEEKGDPRPSSSAIVLESETNRARPDLAEPSDGWTLDMVEQAIVAYVQTRNSQLVADEHGKSRDELDRLLESSDVTMSEEATAVVDLVISQSESRRSLDAEFGISYSHFETELEIDSIKVNDPGNRITVKYWEETELHFAGEPYFISPKSPDDANYTAYAEEYTAEFQLDQNSRTPSITLDSITAQESELPPLTEPLDPEVLFETRAEFEEFLEKAEASLPAERTGLDAPDPVLNSNGEMMPEAAEAIVTGKSVTQPPADASGISSYTGPAVTANSGSHPAINIPNMSYYAWVHWSNYHGAFRSYGNDCANFVSQILSYGGWSAAPAPWPAWDNRANTNYWFYVDNTWYHGDNSGDWNSHSWSVSDHLHHFARNSGRTHARGSIWYLQEGDFLVADWDRDGHKDHSMYVSERTYNTWGGVVILISQHTYNRFKYSLHNTLQAQPGTWWYTQATH